MTNRDVSASTITNEAPEIAVSIIPSVSESRFEAAENEQENNTDKSTGSVKAGLCPLPLRSISIRPGLANHRDLSPSGIKQETSEASVLIIQVVSDNRSDPLENEQGNNADDLIRSLKDKFCSPMLLSSPKPSVFTNAPDLSAARIKNELAKSAVSMVRVVRENRPDRTANEQDKNTYDSTRSVKSISVRATSRGELSRSALDSFTDWDPQKLPEPGKSLKPDGQSVARKTTEGPSVCECELDGGGDGWQA
jgi:hypothetical protein